jgi:hypothetical protein
LETIVFSAAQAGQVNLITYPVLVPGISGLFNSAVITHSLLLVFGPDFFTRTSLPYTKGSAEEMPTGLAEDTGIKTVYDYLIYAVMR